ncbi:HCNGP-like protein-domain-containing protein [Aspergillus coremiiformis]|uniref:HCNGP-like protein-domain-containing protein n=1 Tax=Aspergillus coremiiformis TaxID=138285 RepID=A0A5N6YUD2_9EURO|nr:HCNGP-like protein-domain-containing protein [Aspergillus coremiiformis]
MLGLGVYKSSSEDETEKKLSSPQKHKNKEQPGEVSKTALEVLPHNGSETAPNREFRGPIVGPSQEAHSELHSANTRFSLATSCTLVHDLTLPPVPNLDIPPSPPGSPDAKANKKFAHFLSLKKQYVYFNEKLAASASLKNPSLLTKLMEHVGIDNQVQYFTSLPLEVWDMSGLPGWGFKETLLKAQNDLHQKAEEQWVAGQRDTIHFVNATIAGSSGVRSISHS